MLAAALALETLYNWERRKGLISPLSPYLAAPVCEMTPTTNVSVFS